MKKILLLAVAVYCSISSFAEPTEKILTSFNKAFPQAKNVSWTEDESAYVVYFAKGEEQCRIWYSKEGEILKTIRYYENNLLHPFIRAKVEEKYKDRQIHSVTEVSSTAGTEYFIVLQDDKKWYHVRSDAAGNLALDKKLNKG